MIANVKLGLTHTLSPETKVLYTSIYGNNVLGRISDLSMAWLRNEQPNLEISKASLRVLFQALLEFASSAQEAEAGTFELGVEDEVVFASVRTSFAIENEATVERYFSQYWMNSPEASILRKNLFPHDQVEVRYNRKLQLVEWRVCRPLKQDRVLSPESFSVYCDEDSHSLTSANQNFVNLGDLPYQKWLEEVYSSGSKVSGSGEFFVQGKSVQKETEVARVQAIVAPQGISETVFEAGAEEKNSNVSVTGAHFGEDLSETHFKSAIENVSQVSDDLSSEENQKAIALEVEAECEIYLREIKAKFDSEKVSLQAQAIEVIRQTKLNELKKTAYLKEKNQRYEKMLVLKEQQVQKAATENKKLAGELRAAEQLSSTKVREFRDKALEMYEALKKVKEKCALLESQGSEIGEAVKKEGRGENSSVGGTSNQLDELVKKLDRTTRALETEKSKVKGLSERVIVAEKEAQSSVPLVEDLERKVEHTLKVAQQHKKETEQVKQKLIQSDAEKNKIKNELMKSQAQVQTLLKRHAA